MEPLPQELGNTAQPTYQRRLGCHAFAAPDMPDTKSTKGGAAKACHAGGHLVAGVTALALLCVAGCVTTGSLLCLDSDAPPTGVGEVGVPTVAPAIANAVAQLTGKRLRQLPMSPDRVKQSLG